MNDEERVIIKQLTKNALEHFHSDEPYTEKDDAIRMELIKKLEDLE